MPIYARRPDGPIRPDIEKKRGRPVWKDKKIYIDGFDEKMERTSTEFKTDVRKMEFAADEGWRYGEFPELGSIPAETGEAPSNVKNRSCRGGEFSERRNITACK